MEDFWTNILRDMGSPEKQKEILDNAKKQIQAELDKKYSVEASDAVGSIPENRRVHVTRATLKQLCGYYIDFANQPVAECVYNKPTVFLSHHERLFLNRAWQLLGSPHAFKAFKIKEVKAVDTFTLISEGRVPAYHIKLKCEAMHSDYENFLIPDDVLVRGEEMVVEFRRWFRNNRTLLVTNPRTFVTKLKMDWDVDTSLARIERENSQNEKLKNRTLDQVARSLYQKIVAADAFIHSREYFDEFTERTFQESYKAIQPDERLLISNTPAEIADMRKFELEHKRPIIDELLWFYQLKFNPDICLHEGFLIQLGLMPCEVCFEND